MARKLRLSWSAQSANSHKHPPGYLEDIKAKAFDWDGDTFFLNEKDFNALHKKYMKGTSEEVSESAKRAISISGVSNRSSGLGDTIAKVTSAVGIKPCGGCKKRQRQLNKLVPY